MARATLAADAIIHEDRLDQIESELVEPTDEEVSRLAAALNCSVLMLLTSLRGVRMRRKSNMSK